MLPRHACGATTLFGRARAASATKRVKSTHKKLGVIIIKILNKKGLKNKNAPHYDCGHAGLVQLVSASSPSH
jgi:hypothetical protein